MTLVVQVKRNGDFLPAIVTIRPVQGAARRRGRVAAHHIPGFRSRPTAAATSGNRGRRVRRSATGIRAEGHSGRFAKHHRGLESSNEELKASNEEVMSMNEELQSANEELETSKEELQSLNEELSTVNNQLQDKVAELESANNDMANLLNCTDVAIVFLDNNFRIKRYTSPATRLFNLIPTDLNRPISDITAKFTDGTLQQDIEQVLRTLTPQEKQLQTPDGCCWNRRITLYRTLDNRIDGVILTFTDITQVRRADEQARRLATVLMNSDDAITVQDFDGKSLGMEPRRRADVWVQRGRGDQDECRCR